MRHGPDAPRGLTRAPFSDLPMRRLPILFAVVMLAAAAASAEGQDTTAGTTLRVAGQTPRPATDSLFRRARRLVAEGNGAAGRALVDSLMRAADPVTPAYGDALYWHGALAPTAAEAERDYRRVIVEFPLAYYADDALLAIAELEQARGDRAGALMHLQRYVKEHPASPERGVAALGAARLAFEQRDTKLGCSMIAAARQSATATDVELRNQIEYYNRQCPAASVTTGTPRDAASPAPAPAKAAVSAEVPVRSTQPQRAAAPVSTMPAPVTPTPVTPLPAAPKIVVSTVRVPSPPFARGGTMFTIQLAAYDSRSPADQLVRKLGLRGVKARVSGTEKPFRVRLDFYRSRQEAARAVAALKTRGIIGFVTEEVPPAEVRSP